MSLAAEYRKALANYRPGAPTRDLSNIAAAVADGTLALDPNDPWMAAMGPGRPLDPRPLDPERHGVTIPRRWQYPVGTNLTVTPGFTKLVDFRTLRLLARVYDIARRCIEIRRQEVASMRWEIVPKDPKAQIDPDRQRELVGFFEYPDRINGHRWDRWIKTFLEEVFVVDALSIYPHPTWLPGKGPNKSNLFALEILDGTTIKPLIDARGARPLPPMPAYQQVLHGIPRTQMVTDAAGRDLNPTPPLAQDDVELSPTFRGDELYYEVYNPAADTPYGFSNLEQIVVNVNLALKRQMYWTAYFTDGSVPAGYVEVPEEWDAKMIREFEEEWNSLLGSEVGWKHRIKATPGPFTQLRPGIGEGAGVVLFDEWLAKVTCVGFDVTPTELGLDPKSGLGGTGWSEQQENVLYRKSLRPLTSWIEVILDDILTTWFNSPDLHFRFVFEEIEDAVKRAQQFQIEFQTAQKTVNEIRSELGLPPSEEPNANKLVVVTRQGPELLEDIDAVSKANAGLTRDGKPLPTPPPSAPPPAGAAGESASDDPLRDPEGSDGAEKVAAMVVKANESELRDPNENVIVLEPAAMKRVIDALAKVPTVIICRHGSTATNEKDLIRGWTNPELSELGMKDAKALGEAMAGTDVFKLYCSGLKRTCDTAAEISKTTGVDVTPDKRFRPWNLGDFQGKPVKDSLDQIVDMIKNKPDLDAPGGESFNDFLNRYIPALKEAIAEAEAHPDQFVVVVSHSRNLRAARGWVENGMKGTDVNHAVMVSDEEIAPGGFLVLALEDGKWSIPDEYNDEVELEGQADAKKVVRLDLNRWRTKALRAVKIGRSAAVSFTSDVIPNGIQKAVQAGLAGAASQSEVRAVFDSVRT